MAKILLAEDDGSMRGFLAAALEKAGHEVTATIDGLDALRALESHTDGDFNLLLADIVMPGMDGIELAQKAAELHPSIKVMFITGFAAVAMGARNPQRTQARVLSKPFHLRDLVDQVNQLLAA
ncbi:MAG: response regulator [Rhodospirillales bacterium]|nr:response regulator [Alphaproteobacteria bacterium]MCB9986244.1 response regulator [Rhodospirillales bacterium]USO07201.1 MAG: response regulator [Rhodospirillales bacterium]